MLHLSPHHISQASPSPLLCSFVGNLHLFMTQTKRQSLQENNFPRRWSPGLWDLTAATEAGSPTLSFGWELALVHQGVCSMLRIKGRRDNEVEQKIELEGLCCVCVGGGCGGGREVQKGEKVGPIDQPRSCLGRSLPPSPAIASDPQPLRLTGTLAKALSPRLVSAALYGLDLWRLALQSSGPSKGPKPLGPGTSPASLSNLCVAMCNVLMCMCACVCVHGRVQMVI